MVYPRIILQLVEFMLCLVYDAVIWTVIPECIEAIVFHFRVVTDAYVSAKEQIQSLELVIVYALLVIVIISITVIRCGVRVKPYLWHQRKIALCSKCQRKEHEKEIRKGLSRSEQNWLYGFGGGLFSSLGPKWCSNNCKIMEKKPGNIRQSSRSVKPRSEEQKTQSKPKTGKIERVVPMGVPFSPKRFNQIQKLSQRSSSD